jgi:hypothetical protein
MSLRRRWFGPCVAAVCLCAFLGWLAAGMGVRLAGAEASGEAKQVNKGPDEKRPASLSAAKVAARDGKTAERAEDVKWTYDRRVAAAVRHMLQSPPAATNRDPTDWGLGPNYYTNLPEYPAAGDGERTPFDLWRYRGRGQSSNFMQLSSKRSIRSLDHFSEVEEYFDGDPGSLGQPIGLANRQRQLTNRMGDFSAILIGRPEGPIKTFGLRGIKDSPPYLHDGRCPTLHDAVEFFNLIVQLKLTSQEKEDLVAYLLCL